MYRKGKSKRRSSRGHMVVRLLFFAGALAGLLAMHGLSDHGAASHAVHAPMSPAATAMAQGSQMAGAALGAAQDAGVAPGVPDEGSVAMSMAGVCLVVLASAIVGLLLVPPHRRALWVRTIALAFVQAPLSGRRDRDPPCLLELSVLRT